MVGETKDMIPTSGVMFTREPAGNTPGVVHIESTYGHNEAVVNPEHQGKVGVDSFYVGSSGFIHAALTPKKQRLAPSQKNNTLEYVKNAQDKEQGS